LFPALELAYQVDRVAGTALAGLGESSPHARHCCLNEREKARAGGGENYSDTEHTVPEPLNVGAARNEAIAPHAAA
jgi:hypothetical protein